MRINAKFFDWFDKDNTYSIQDLLIIKDPNLIKTHLPAFNEKLGFVSKKQIEKQRKFDFSMFILIAICPGIASVICFILEIPWTLDWSAGQNKNLFLGIALLLSIYFFLAWFTMAAIFITKAKKAFKNRWNWIKSLINAEILTDSFLLWPKSLLRGFALSGSSLSNETQSNYENRVNYLACLEAIAIFYEKLKIFTTQTQTTQEKQT